MTHSDWTRKYLAPLIGCRVTDVAVSPDGYPTITFKGPKGVVYRVEVSRDAEGNGPGFLFGLPRSTGVARGDDDDDDDDGPGITPLGQVPDRGYKEKFPRR